MHEVALAQGIVDLVAERAEIDGFKRVLKVRVAVGSLSTVMPEALQFGFESAARGTVVEGAALEIDEIEGEAYCTDCEKRFFTKSRLASCPACQSARCMVTGGDALRVSELEVE
jgi:hydrogenase nickel incorporation protein HypA/HybF